MPASRSKSTLRAGHDGVGPHDERRGELLARQVAALVVRGKDLLPAVVVEQRLPQAPAGRLADHLHRIAQPVISAGTAASVWRAPRAIIAQ